MSRNGSHARVLKPRPLSTQSSQRRNESSIRTYSNINTGGFFVLKINPVNTFTRATSNCASLFIYFSLFRSNWHTLTLSFAWKYFCFFFRKKNYLKLDYSTMSPFKATIFLAVGLCLFANYINAEDAKDNAEDEENVIKVFKRLIPADVLRGLCRFFHSFFSEEIFFR